jgi:endonuclease/exonuclease/phosphatase family metal-dependent hydrolase
MGGSDWQDAEGGGTPRAILLLDAAALLQAVLLLVVWLCVRFAADRWWPATVMLFVPRWIYAAPLLLVAPAALIARRALPILAVALSLIVALVLNGLCIPMHLPFGTPPGTPIRVMTYNVGQAHFDGRALQALLDEVGEPQIVGLEECPGDELTDWFKANGWNVHSAHGACLLSRFPIRQVDIRDPSDFWKINGSGVINRYELDVHGRIVSVMLVHLETVREGLQPMLRLRPWLGRHELVANQRERDLESRAAAEWAARAKGPILVMGDFNMPVESAIYRRYWSRYHNAFSEAGLGFGYSKETEWHGLRIDQILTNDDWSCDDASVGRDLGGDHRPVFARLHLTD